MSTITVDGRIFAGASSRVSGFVRSWRRLAVPLLAFLVGWGHASPALAAFGNCNEPAYLRAFDEVAGDGSFDCVERLRVPINGSDGTRHIRVIHHRHADWVADAALLGRFDEGVHGVAAAVGRLGALRLKNITVLLLDSGYVAPDVSAEGGSIVASMIPAEVDECRLVIYLLSAAADRDHAAQVVAHELFHCVQQANLSPARMRSGATGTAAGGDWWLEGSAEWFAQLAVPERARPLFERRVQRFDQNSMDRPLSRMAYEAVVFFLWLAQERGPHGILPFLGAMADRRDERAQFAAMAAALPAAAWLRFAQDYLDRKIVDGQGRPIPSRPDPGPDWAWNETRTQVAEVRPFQLLRAKLHFACGRWAVSATPAPAHAQREGATGGWQELPATIDVREDAQERQYAGWLVAAEARRLQLRAVRETACGDCAGVSTLDACLPGTWSMVAHDTVQTLNRKTAPDLRFSSGQQMQITFARDGRYSMEPVVVQGKAAKRGSAMQGTGQLTGGQHRPMVRGRRSIASVPGCKPLCGRGHRAFATR